MYQQLEWSKAEKNVAKRAFNLALEREGQGLIEKVRRKASAIRGLDDVWKLNDFIWNERKAIDEKYDYRYSVLIMVFAGLISEGLLTEDDLEGLGQDKMRWIRTILSLGKE
ncbi:MAG TPA: hypothetical protein VI756_07385 [Blastocatellia bacterium]